jgi:hypothetical protein
MTNPIDGTVNSNFSSLYIDTFNNNQSLNIRRIDEWSDGNDTVPPWECVMTNHRWNDCELFENDQSYDLVDRRNQTFSISKSMGLGATWVFFQDDTNGVNIIATVERIKAIKFKGRTDSVAVIHLSGNDSASVWHPLNNQTFSLLKSGGFWEFFIINKTNQYPKFHRFEPAPLTLENYFLLQPGEIREYRYHKNGHPPTFYRYTVDYSELSEDGDTVFTLFWFIEEELQSFGDPPKMTHGKIGVTTTSSVFDNFKGVVPYHLDIGKSLDANFYIDTTFGSMATKVQEGNYTFRDSCWIIPLYVKGSSTGTTYSENHGMIRSWWYSQGPDANIYYDNRLTYFKTASQEFGEKRFFASIDETKRYPLLVYPNPAKDKIVLPILEKIQNDDVHLKIMDVAGQTLIHYVTFDSSEIDISKLPCGVYIVLLTTDNQTFQSKLVKR